MAGSIGGIACTFVHGELPALKERAEVWTRAGYDGYGIALLGEGDGEGQVEAELRSSQAGVTTWYDLLQGLQGQIVSVTTHNGQTKQAFIQRVDALRREARFEPGTVVTQRGLVAIRLVVVA